jgi:hypothetical protein
MAAMAPVLSARELVARHEEWKLTLWAAIFSRSALTEEQLTQIVHADQCPIGRWLLSEASAHLAHCDEYKAVVEEHKNFHAEMLEVASLISAKDFRAAGKAIGDSSSFMQCSRRLSRAMMGLNRVSRLEVPA